MRVTVVGVVPRLLVVTLRVMICGLPVVVCCRFVMAGRVVMQ
jgi:hypothetical protein